MGKRIKIFLASSEELESDRCSFGNLIRRLDNIYEKRGIRIELFEWEDYDAAYNSCPKQCEYNTQVRASDMFLALFHKKAGKYTIEEFDVATEEFQRNGEKPKSYVYCRDLQEGEQETKELKEFKMRLLNEMGHYWCRYNNKDSLHFHFVMQLLLVENNHMDKLRIENGEIILDGTTVARMDNLRFASCNEDYQRINARLLKMPSLIAKAQSLTQKYPNDDDLRDNLHQLIKERIDLEEEFSKQQNFLFDTAKRIVQMKEEEITDRMRRAIEAFENGNVREANIILTEAEHDAENARNDYRQSKIITENKRKIFINSIKELWLKTSTLMADVSIPIAERIEKTHAIYVQTVEMAQEASYEKDEFCRLLYDYAIFLYDYAFYGEALEIIQKQIALTSEKVKSFNVKGNVLYRLDRFHEALAILNKALGMLIDDDSSDESLIAITHNNIGRVFNRIGEFDKAIEQAQNALNSSGDGEKEKLSNSAKSFENIAEGLWSQGSCMKALDNFEKALDIEKRIYGDDSIEAAITYRHIGDAYRGLSDNNKALENYYLALSIIEKRLGSRHPETALTYGCLGVSYMELHKYKEALDYTQKGLEIREDIFGKDNTNTAESYYWLGEIYSKRSEFQNFDTAIRYYNKAKDIRKTIYGESNEDTLNVEYSIADLYINQGKYSEAIDVFQKYVEILEAQKNIKPRIIVAAYYHLGIIYVSSKKYSDAINYLEKSLIISEVEDYTQGSIHVYLASIYKNMGELLKSIGHSVEALTILKRINGEKNSDIACLYNFIGSLYDEIKDFDRAMDYYKIALLIQESSIDTEDFGTAGIYYNIGLVQDKLENYSEALIYFKKALEWVNKHKINDIGIAEIYNGIGLVYYNQGEYSQALEYFLKAEETKEDLSDIATYYCNIGNAYYAQGNYTQALKYFLKAVSIRENDLGTTHPDVVSLYSDIGLLYCQIEKYSEATEYLEKLLKVLEVHEQDPESNNPTIATDLETIGLLYYNLGDFGNAVYYHFKSMEMKEKMYGVMNVETAKSYMNYGAACFNRGSYGTALEYFKKAVNVFQEKLGSTALETQNAQEWIDAVKLSIDNE